MNTRIIHYLRTLVVLVALSLSIAACEASTANIANAELSRGYTDGKATDVTTTFAPSDTPIHCVVTLNDGQIKDQKLDEAVLQTGSGTLDFTLTNAQEWPAGTYKVDLSLNDKPDRTVEFHVQ